MVKSRSVKNYLPLQPIVERRRTENIMENYYTGGDETTATGEALQNSVRKNPIIIIPFFQFGEKAFSV